MAKYEQWQAEPSDAGDTIVPHGIEDAVIDVREDVTFASDTSKPDDSEPITAEWWRSQVGSRWYGDLTRDESWWIQRHDIDSSISLRCECSSKEPTLDLPHIRTRSCRSRRILRGVGRGEKGREPGRRYKLTCAEPANL